MSASPQNASLSSLDALRRGDMAGSRELTLRGLSEFPKEVFALADTLEVLDIGGGSLTALPDDFAKLHRLRILFASGNNFDRLPPVIGQCESLSQIGFRGVGLREVPAESLPRSLRWLILTDNRIADLPSSLGELPKLQKLMLAGNALSKLPASLEGASSLELIRIGANQFETIPSLLASLPCLAWVSWAGNPLERRTPLPAPAFVQWRDLLVEQLLGEGTSGRVYRAIWHEAGTGRRRSVALKIFKGSMTSDGRPEREIVTCLAAGEHPNLTGALGRVVDHPDGAEAMVMPLVAFDSWVLAGPPSFESCTRDVYDGHHKVAPKVALQIAIDVASAVGHLHRRNLLHGDLYAHNTLWDGKAARALLSDFGAACVLPSGPAADRWRRIEVRAWGLLLEELLRNHIAPQTAQKELRTLADSCLQRDISARPLMNEVTRELAAMLQKSNSSL